MRGGVLAALWGGALWGAAFAQPLPANSAWAPGGGPPLDAWLEPLAEEDGDPSELLERLEDLLRRPLDLNAASAEALSALPALSPRIAEAVVRHRAEHGPFRDVPGLLAVEGVTEETLDALHPFVTVHPPASPRLRPRLEAVQRVQRRLDLGRGYAPLPDSLRDHPDAPTRYAGSPERLYTRLRGGIGRVSANLTMEKDPGEPTVWAPAQRSFGLDHVSAHLSLQGGRGVETMVIGDYVVEAGQGLVLWRASGFGKGREAVGPMVRRGRGVRPSGSAEENLYFRGAAATLAPHRRLRLTGFVSRHRVDARMTEPDSLGGRYVLSRPTSGLHRTPTERAARKALGQTVFGGVAQVGAEGIGLGVAAHRTAWEFPLTPGPQPYQRLGIDGTSASAASLFGHASLPGAYVFGEAGADGRGAKGGVGGVEIGAGPVSLLALARHYPAPFSSPHGHAFGERNGATQNEAGVYLGARVRPGPRWTLSGYVDQFQFPGARAGVVLPSRGLDALAYAEHRPRQWLTVSVQGRSAVREVSIRAPTPTGGEVYGLTEEVRRSLRLDGAFVANRALRLRGRLEGARYRRGDAPPDRGTALYQDIRWTPSRAVTLDARLTLFDTEGFGARLYQYEQDLSGVMTNALLLGQGSRAYAVLTWRPYAGLDLQAKAASWRYEDRDVVGSGLDAVEGRRVRDVGVLVRYRL